MREAESIRPGLDRPGLDQLGLRPGEPVRWRRRPGDRWQPGEVVGIERDGSLGIRDRKGAARAIPLAAVEVTAPPRRKGAKPGWEPLLARAGRTEQLRLEPAGPPPKRTGSRRTTSRRPAGA